MNFICSFSTLYSIFEYRSKWRSQYRSTVARMERSEIRRISLCTGHSIQFSRISLRFIRATLLQIERPEIPNVEKWYERLQERPGYREHVMIPFDDMRERLEY